ncbi:hypothetical protein SANTM175S_06198 [Streptomyces antimycoticus]
MSNLPTATERTYCTITRGEADETWHRGGTSSNAYTFAKKRMVASFVQPSPTVMDDGAPRPLRAFLPGVIVGALILAGFGAWGMIRPTAPKGWDNTASHIIVGSDSTTRYVILKTGGKKQLHPVLNLASHRHRPALPGAGQQRRQLGKVEDRC